MKKIIAPVFLSFLLFFSFCTTQQNEHQQTTLKQSANYPVGTAVGFKWLKNDTTARKIIQKDFNSLTAENCMKMYAVQPKQDSFVWKKTDYLVEFCRQNDIRLHGHALNWYLSTPKWVKAYNGDSSALEQILKNHIQTYAGRYKGKVASWDVVNEALADETGGYRSCVWFDELGKDYVARSFKYARQADPDVKLFYNDYYLESDTAKLETCLKMIDEFQQKNIPIDGIGLQFHLYIDHPSIDAIENALEEFTKRDLLIHISELDITFNHHRSEPKYHQFTDSMAMVQKQRYFEIVDAYQRIVPKEQQYGISVWGFLDKYTWIRSFFDIPAWPCLYDDDYQAKPAYFGFLKAAQQQ